VSELQSLPTVHVAVVFLAYLVLGFAGFGSALIAIPLLAWDSPLSMVVPMVLIMDILASTLFAGLNFRHVAWQELPRLAPAVLVGTLVGTFWISQSSGQWLLGLLGIYVVVIGVRGLRQATENPRQDHTAHVVRLGMAGLLMGVVETVFGTAGPIVLSWLAQRLPDPHQLRATVSVSLLFLSLIALSGIFFAGAIHHDDMWRRLGFLLPCALLGVWLGHRLASGVNIQAFRRWIFCLLISSGCALVYRSLSAV
jgi:uncharacterized protein